MANCEFKFDHTQDPEKIYSKAKSAIEDNGGEINGDQKHGNFSISKLGMSVEGRFEISESEVKLYIDKKPIFVSCEQIKGMIGSNFS
ncbi:MAG: hypothetical protein ACK4ND_01030 [Cytophagaceae bacterium]